MLQHINPIIINGSREKPILIDINVPDTLKPSPVVIFIHGFKGFKDWGHFNLISQYLSKAGYMVIKFNFSYNGTTINTPTEFTDLEAFGNNNLTTELNDIGCVLDYICSNSFIAKQYTDTREIYLIGHSRGGGIALLKAYEDKRVTKVMALAPIHKFGGFFPDDALTLWEQKGVRYEKNSRTGQLMPMYWQYILDLRANTARLDIPKALEYITIPTLIIHGTGDATLPYINSINVRQLNPEIDIVLIEHADHNFGGKHPWTQDTLPEHTEMWLEEVVRFFTPL